MEHNRIFDLVIEKYGHFLVNFGHFLVKSGRFLGNFGIDVLGQAVSTDSPRARSTRAGPGTIQQSAEVSLHLNRWRSEPNVGRELYQNAEGQGQPRDSPH